MDFQFQSLSLLYFMYYISSTPQTLLNEKHVHVNARFKLPCFFLNWGLNKEGKKGIVSIAFICQLLHT